MELSEILRGVKKNKRKAQKALYEKYNALFMAIAVRYLKHPQEAEDVVAESFIKIFTKIKTFKDSGSFEGWMKRIVINECLMKLRQNKKKHLYIPLDDVDIEMDATVLDKMSADEILAVIGELPEGYRTVFNLYVIEGLKHREIAEELGISIHTSKSQLIMAKRKLQNLLKKSKYEKINELQRSNSG